MTPFIFHSNFWEFFFAPNGQHFYEGNVWGNIVAWVICGIFAFLWIRSKFIAHAALAKQHHAESMQAHAETQQKHEELLLRSSEESDENTKKILDALDINTDGGLKDILLAINKNPGVKATQKKKIVKRKSE